MNLKTLIPWAIPLALMAMTATGCGRHSAHNPERAVAYITKKLDLAPDQQTRVSGILEGLVADQGAHKAVRSEIYADVVEQLRSDTFDTAHLNRRIDAATAGMEDHFRKVSGALAEVHAALTPEQREKLAALMVKHQDRGHRRHHSH
ncbi:MAG: Spy/CpxP family protein refolding chaperone [Leptospirillia bacterium]